MATAEHFRQNASAFRDGSASRASIRGRVRFDRRRFPRG